MSLVALIAATAIAVPAAVLASHSWGGYHWARTSNPFTLKVGDNVTSAWDSYLNTTIADWSVSTVADLVKVAGTQNVKRCGGTTGRVEVCNAKYGNTGWLGIAGISITGGTHITKGYVKLNDTYFASGSYNTPAWRNLVSCQEVGHTLGLGHVDENFTNPNQNTCMDYTNSPESNQHPNAHDYQMLETLYAHLDSTTTISASLPSGRGATSIVDQLDQNHPAAWGRLVAATPGHGIEMYELDLGKGSKQVTIVTWTLEAAASRRAAHQHAD